MRDDETGGENGKRSGADAGPASPDPAEANARAEAIDQTTAGDGVALFHIDDGDRAPG